MEQVLPCPVETCRPSNTPRYTGTRGLPTDLVAEAADFASACLPNRRIDHGVVQSHRVVWVPISSSQCCPSSYGYVVWVGERIGGHDPLHLEKPRLGLEQRYEQVNSVGAYAFHAKLCVAMRGL